MSYVLRKGFTKAPHFWYIFSKFQHKKETKLEVIKNYQNYFYFTKWFDKIFGSTERLQSLVLSL